MNLTKYVDRFNSAFKNKNEPNDITDLLNELIVVCDPLTKAHFEKKSKKTPGKMYLGPRCVADCVSMQYRCLWCDHADTRKQSREYILSLAKIADAGIEVSE